MGSIKECEMAIVITKALGNSNKQLLRALQHWACSTLFGIQLCHRLMKGKKHLSCERNEKSIIARMETSLSPTTKDRTEEFMKQKQPLSLFEIKRAR